jgi:glycolate oxidase FAD binding subunit
LPQCPVEPATERELADCLKHSADAKEPIELGVTLTTRALNRVLNYEPRDLTISVEAGMPYAKLGQLLAADGLMLPLDPPWSETATIGGIVSANRNGPRRRLYGTARDMVIGMRFAMLTGEVASSGGMVVKNVAGLDMAKLMIGSFGTLAGIASVNFKLTPAPKQTRTLVFRFKTAQEAFALRNRVLKSILPVAALDILNPAAAARCSADSSWILALQAVTAVERYGAEFPGGEDAGCQEFWPPVREFTPRWLAEHPSSIVARYSTTHAGMQGLMESLQGPAVARAASGVVYAYGSADAAGRYVLEHAPPGVDRWPSPGPDFAMMQSVKRMFDPQGLLNQGALYGRI